MSQSSQSKIDTGELTIADEGHLFIPADDRREHGIEHHDCVHVTVETAHGESFTVEYLPVLSKGDVNVPDRLMDVYGLSPGDEVSVTLRQTSVTLG